MILEVFCNLNDSLVLCYVFIWSLGKHGTKKEFIGSSDFVKYSSENIGVCVLN